MRIPAVFRGGDLVRLGTLDGHCGAHCARVVRALHAIHHL